ncbi:UNVERIFIED_CONTAM: hypothetical protein FKN15_010892 [Acipenser sinensis]
MSHDVLMFETDDLVLRKNEKHFVLCLLEVARRASRFGMAAPVLIQLEEEIEEEIREELDLPHVETPKHKPLRRMSDFKNLDQMVQYLVSRCTCPSQFPMVKVSEGKYRVGDSSTLIFVRIAVCAIIMTVSHCFRQGIFINEDVDKGLSLTLCGPMSDLVRHCNYSYPVQCPTSLKRRKKMVFSRFFSGKSRENHSMAEWEQQEPRQAEKKGRIS